MKTELEKAKRMERFVIGLGLVMFSALLILMLIMSVTGHDDLITLERTCFVMFPAGVLLAVYQLALARVDVARNVSLDQFPYKLKRIKAKKERKDWWALTLLNVAVFVFLLFVFDFTYSDALLALGALLFLASCIIQMPNRWELFWFKRIDKVHASAFAREVGDGK